MYLECCTAKLLNPAIIAPGSNLSMVHLSIRKLVTNDRPNRALASTVPMDVLLILMEEMVVALNASLCILWICEL